MSAGGVGVNIRGNKDHGARAVSVPMVMTKDSFYVP